MELILFQFTWLFMLLHFFLISAQSFKDFLPTIVSSSSKRIEETPDLIITAPNDELVDFDDLPSPVAMLPSRIPGYSRFRLEFRSL